MNSSESAIKPPTNAASTTLAMPTQTLRRTNLATPVKFPRRPTFLSAGLREMLPDGGSGAK